MFEKVHEFINFAPVGGDGGAPAGNGATNAAAQQPGGFGAIWFILIFFVLMYVLLILPQKRQEKKHKAMLSDLQKGDKIITSSGIIGKIISIYDDKIRITTGDRTDIDITRNAISAIIGKKSTDQSQKSSSSELENSTEDENKKTK